MNKRKSGILLHITSLPSSYGIGDLGPAAYRFADFLSEAKQRFWQILPLNPTEIGSGNSPYSSVSAFAGNTLLISLELLERDGLIDKKDLEIKFPEGPVDYASVVEHRNILFGRAHEKFLNNSQHKKDYEIFCKKNKYWLDDFALFVVLKENFKIYDWSKWPEDLRNREKKSLNDYAKKFQKRSDKGKFLQYIFFKQWNALKKYCNTKGIEFIGDVPIYVDYNSVDVWVNQDIFKLNEKKHPEFVGGVPPDYFSKTGQRWGNPVYRWDILKNDGYNWWFNRIQHNIEMFDVLRIDHFRGLVGYWEIPAEEKTAVNGYWVEVPAKDFFTKLLKKFPKFRIIAEDLGVITPDVKKIMKKFHFPGMRLLIFAFGEDMSTHPYLPHNYINECVALTGTHDTNTFIGWYKNEATEEIKNKVLGYLKKDVSLDILHWECIKMLMESVAYTAIFPMQDILGYDQDARMNMPSTIDNNWRWRATSEVFTPELSNSLRNITKSTNRT